MTRKKFVKKLMCIGLSRNHAAWFAEYFQEHKIPYYHFGFALELQTKKCDYRVAFVLPGDLRLTVYPKKPFILPYGPELGFTAADLNGEYPAFPSFIGGEQKRIKYPEPPPERISGFWLRNIRVPDIGIIPTLYF